MNCKINLAVLMMLVCCGVLPGCVSTEDANLTGDPQLKAGIEKAFPGAEACTTAAKKAKASGEAAEAAGTESGDAGAVIAGQEGSGAGAAEAEDAAAAAAEAGETAGNCRGGYLADTTMQKIEAGNYTPEVQFGMAAESVQHNLENYRALNEVAAGVVEKEIPLAEKFRAQLDGGRVSAESRAARSQRMQANLELMNYVLDTYTYEYNYAVSMRDTLESYHAGEELSAAATASLEQLNAGIEALEEIYEAMQQSSSTYGELLQSLGLEPEAAALPEAEAAALPEAEAAAQPE